MSNCNTQNKRFNFLRKRSGSLLYEHKSKGWTKIFCHSVLAYTRMRYVSCLVPIPLKQMRNFFRENKGNLRGKEFESFHELLVIFRNFLYRNSKSFSFNIHHTTRTAPRFQPISHINITEFHNHHWTLNETHALTCCCFS